MLFELNFIAQKDIRFIYRLLDLREGNEIEWKWIKRIILEYSSISLGAALVFLFRINKKYKLYKIY